jgi:inner membrane transporter RhtA
VVVAGACWGLSAVIAKIAFDRGVPPTRMAEARVVVALVILTLILLTARRDLFRPPPRSVARLAAFGLCVALVNGSYYVAIDRLAVGVAISLQYTDRPTHQPWAGRMDRGGGHPGRRSTRE